MRTGISTIPTMPHSSHRHGRALAVCLALFASSCSPHEAGNEVDIANAARTAQLFADRYAKSSAGRNLIARSNASASPSRAQPATVTRPHAPDPAEGAVAVVANYFALIENGGFPAAWRLWDHDGTASGLTVEAFTASFDRYRLVRAEVGLPGRIDAGAGQRYVTVPVKTYGTLRDGSAFMTEGSVTLHQTIDIDGTTAAQRDWRIDETNLKLQPQTPPPASEAGKTIPFP